MIGEPFFGLASYHVALATIGGGIIIAFWLPRLFSGREPAASWLLILAGLLAFTLMPGMPAALDPRVQSSFWERTSELAVIVALFGTGIRIDRVPRWRRWRPALRLLVLLMPLTIAAVALLGWLAAGMTLAGALLLGAVLAPTDPVLAGDVQVGPPTEGGEHPVRFSLTTEAGLNDGLAFPFVYLALIIAAQGWSPAAWGLEWLARDVVYRIGMGAASGAAVGWVLGKVIFALPRGNVLADTSSGVVALAGVLLCYGLAELAEGYGFIAAFVCGLMLRRSEEGHSFHTKLHSFTEAIEHALTALLLILMGGVIPLLWDELGWKDAAIAIGLIFLIRPLFGFLCLGGTDLRGRDRVLVAFFGVRGIGSIYYLAFASSHAHLTNEGELWAIVTFTILLSTMVHGLTAGAALERTTDG
ncbi:cation:proton antiporter [Sphingobium bisphenolivorans]|uniref:cation:proton antiporter n=1 Tax=Sphingobium bisphenolivorans TaxID=1335760 RepID=UPI00039993EA|nr:cation:proton antiporter [Sphingobium bisphenolivorans]